MTQQTDAWDAVPDPQTVLPDEELAGLSERETAELRRLRAACEDAEEGVSYARRLLQGRLDILRAELEQRDGAGDVLDALPRILAADQVGSGASQPRAVRLRVPPDADAHAAAIDAIVDAYELERVERRDVDTLATLAERLGEHERRLSQLRRAWFDRIDAVRAELAARYRDGRASVSELLEQ